MAPDPAGVWLAQTSAKGGIPAVPMVLENPSYKLCCEYTSRRPEVLHDKNELKWDITQPPTIPNARTAQKWGIIKKTIRRVGATAKGRTGLDGKRMMML